MESIVALRGKDALGRLGRVFIAAVLVALVALCTFAPTGAHAEETTDASETSVYLAPAEDDPATQKTRLAPTGDTSSPVPAAIAGAAVAVVAVGLATKYHRVGGSR